MLSWPRHVPSKNLTISEATQPDIHYNCVDKFSSISISKGYLSDFIMNNTCKRGNFSFTRSFFRKIHLRKVGHVVSNISVMDNIIVEDALSFSGSDLLVPYLHHLNITGTESVNHLQDVYLENVATFESRSPILLKGSSFKNIVRLFFYDCPWKYYILTRINSIWEVSYFLFLFS